MILTLTREGQNKSPNLVQLTLVATQLKVKAKNNSTTYIDVDRDEVDESLLGAFAVVIPAGDPDDVTSAVAGAAAVNSFLAIGSVLLGTVRDLDLDVEI